MTNLVLVDNYKYIRKLTLNREQASNAFDDEMITQLCDELLKADIDDSVRVIIVTGKGKSFCAGGDVKAMQTKSGMFAGESEELRQRYRRGIQRIPQVMESLQKPVIAMVQGAAIGAGCDFAAMADMRIASQNAKFGETFVSLGLVPGDGGTYFLSRLIGYAKAFEMYATAKIYTADEALNMGLVNQVVESDVLEKITMEIAQRIACNAPIAVQMTKKALKMAHKQSIHEQLELLAAYQGITQRTQDHFIGIENLLEKKHNEFIGK